MIKPPSDMISAQPTREFLSFEKIEIEGGARQRHTSYFCRIKSLHNGKEININVQIELPHSDKTLSEIEREIAQAIHEAINPARLGGSPS
jgi:hypothetical protein